MSRNNEWESWQTSEIWIKDYFGNNILSFPMTLNVDKMDKIYFNLLNIVKYILNEILVRF